MPPPASVVELVERFDSNLAAYRSGGYNEAQLRQEFLNPFFEALGWDVYNKKGYAEAYKEVIHEAAVKVGGRTKAPDYCFRAGGGVRGFFVEAKKPSVDIAQAVSPAYQLRRYAWSAKLPVSILSDFEEFAVYDCRIRPIKTDRASTARVIYRKYTEYPDCWDELSELFSPEAIRRGSLDRFIASKKVKKGTAEVDDAFLGEIETWRDVLARNIALRNGDLSQRDLNFAVQRTIDRIVFLRICEDRGIEPYGRLQTLVNGPDVYRRLAELFQRADERYNSGLFYFSAEKARGEPPDELTLALAIDDKPLKEILKHLYFPDSPYEFSVFPAQILGQVYEQFLGKVIRLTSGHRAVVEDKPEVKKAGGVYYTPSYIVDYIVEHTVGKLLQGESGGPKAESGKPKAESGEPKAAGKPRLARGGHARALTPNQAAKLRILDPACGSGSFLLGAYQYLLDWHRDWYEQDDPAKHARGRNARLYCARSGDWRLTTAERKRILLNNIYGVDIDPQAVEVTKLSLLLKVLEGESEETLSTQLRLFHERALPDLADNIKCGNSLIGPDFYQGKQLDLFDEDERLHINVFDWQAEFSAIMEAGGFDVVIGNPPYVRVQRLAHNQIDYFFEKYDTPASKTDISQLFLERSLALSSPLGRVGLISTSQWLATDYGSKMRRLLSTGMLHEVVNFGSLPVFKTASTYPGIFILSPTKGDSLQFRNILEREQLSLDGIRHGKCLTIALDRLSDSPWNFGCFDLLASLESRAIPWCLLKAMGRAHYGIISGCDAAFIFDRQVAQELELETEIVFPFAFRGEEVRRYEKTVPSSLIIYPYVESEGGESLPMDPQSLESRHPNAYRVLSSHKRELSARKDSRRLFTARAHWYRLVRAASFNVIRPAKLIVKGIDRKVQVGLLDSDSAFSGANCPAITLDESDPHSRYYVLGLLNSALMSFHLRAVCPPKLNDYRRFNANSLNKAPMRRIDFENSSDVSLHDRMVEFVQDMVLVHERARTANTAHERTALTRQIKATDREIDRLVYELYELTDEEIAIVEEGTT